MAKIPIQLPRYLIRKPKNQAMATLCAYVMEHASDFVAGEEVILRYLLDNGNLTSTNVFVNNPEEGDLSFVIGESETIKIVESPTEPEDKDVLWLTDASDEGEDIHGNIRDELDALKKKFKTLQELVNRHEYSFNNALSGGNVKRNSTKFSLSNLAAQEQPTNSNDIYYDEENTAITVVKIFVGKYELDSGDTLYVKQKYYLNVKAYNDDENEVSLSGCTILYNIEGDIEIGPYDTLYSEEEVNISLSATIILPDNTIVNSETYGITFSDEEEPSYYTEPTYHQFTTKNAKDFDELVKYIDNIAVGEFCWCIAENALYYRAESASHSVQIFKINGGGSIEPETDVITYEITENGILIITAENDAVYIDEEGILHLPGELDEDGILHLTDKKKE